MKNKNVLILAAVFAAVLALAFGGYRFLTVHYEATTPPAMEQETPAVEEELQEETPEEVVAAPDFTVLDGAGEEVRLSDYAGKPVVINFWATWCGPCKSELPAFENMYQKYGEEMAFMMVNVTDGGRETVDGVKTFVEEGGYTFPVFYDTTLHASAVYGANSIPLTVFVLPDGTLAGGYRGAITEEILEESIQIVLEMS